MTQNEDKVNVRMLPSIKAALAVLNSIPTHETIVVDGREMEVVKSNGVKVLRAMDSNYQYNDDTDRPRDGRTFSKVHMNNHRATAMVGG